MVGLGTGTFACFAERGDSFKFYEIDASVEKLARDPARFRYLEQCGPDIPVVLGDARLTLAESPDKYDLIVLDAFSSDAIPVHLMTREAMAIYVSKLAPGGIVMMHVSNRHMEFASVVAGIAHANGLVSRVNNRAAREGEEDARYVFTSNVVVSAREAEGFRTVARRRRLDRAEYRCDAAHLDRRLLEHHRRDLPESEQGPPVAHAGGMTMPSERFEFPNARGEKLAAVLDRPVGEPIAYALFAHCFTCGKDVLAAKRIAEGLTMRGIAVLRFDFTGLGASEGEFANTTFSSNVGDLVAAANHLRKTHRAPGLLIGHSLGGAAVLAAAQHCPEARAVVTIAAPADPAHVTGLFRERIPEIEEKGEVEVALAGRPFRIRKEFLDDVAEQKLQQCLANLRKALLVMHSPTDDLVGIENASAIFTAAKHPEELHLAEWRGSSARQAR